MELSNKAQYTDHNSNGGQVVAEKPEKFPKELVASAILDILFGPIKFVGVVISIIQAILFGPVRFMDLIVKFFGIQDVWIKAVITGNIWPTVGYLLEPCTLILRSLAAQS